MAARFFALAAAVVSGLVVGDILTHPAGTTAAGQAIVGIEKPVGNQLLGVAQ